jgi:hypothetical protein
MPQLSKETQKFLLFRGADLRDSQDVKKILRPIPNSASRITPGDLLIFRYWHGTGEGSREQKVVLIVKCGRGAGVFPGREGKLVSCFKMRYISEPVIDVLLKNLYMKRTTANIKETLKYITSIRKSLQKLTGGTDRKKIQKRSRKTSEQIQDTSFRTYKLDKMKELFKVYLGEE